jgi:hypothetical protein
MSDAARHAHIMVTATEPDVTSKGISLVWLHKNIALAKTYLQGTLSVP